MLIQNQSMSDSVLVDGLTCQCARVCVCVCVRVKRHFDICMKLPVAVKLN